MMKNFKTILLLQFFIVLLYGCEKSSNPIEEDPDTEEQISGLVAWYPLDAGSAEDKSAHRNNGQNHGATTATNRHGEAGKASYFDGISNYIEIPDQDHLSIAETKELTISVWLKLEVLNYPSTERQDYIHWMGKGTTGQHEYTLRMYNLDSTYEPGYRPNRTSAYVFNPSGGLGAGAMFEEELFVDQWMHVVAVYDYPNDSIKIYRDGRHKSRSTFSSYTIIPRNGTAPLRIGTRDFASYFKGYMDDLKIYNRALRDQEIRMLFEE